MESAALIVAIVALVISVAAFAYELISRRRQLLLAIFEKLLEGDQQRGRRLVHELAETGVCLRIWMSHRVTALIMHCPCSTSSASSTLADMSHGEIR
jgi:hypothetical protein